MATLYERLGVRFVYPENWRLAEDEAIDWPRSVSVESPAGAFWSVMIYPDEIDPQRAIRDTLDALRGEYEQVEFEPAHDPIAATEARGFDLRFFYLDMVIAAQLRGLRVGDQTLVVLAQGEDRDFERLEQVFRAMTESLVRCGPGGELA